MVKYNQSATNSLVVLGSQTRSRRNATSARTARLLSRKAAKTRTPCKAQVSKQKMIAFKTINKEKTLQVATNDGDCLRETSTVPLVPLVPQEARIITRDAPTNIDVKNSQNLFHQNQQNYVLSKFFDFSDEEWSYVKLFC